MAVVVQEIVAGERSGVAFSCHPENDDRPWWKPCTA